MLRLAPSHPPLWRTASSLQLGADAAIRLDDIAHWQERLLDALREGIPDAMMLPLARSFGAPPRAAERFIARISGALTSHMSVPLDVQVEVPATLRFAESDALLHGLAAADVQLRSLTHWAQDDPDPRVPMIVVVHRLLEPRRAALLMASEIAHLPIELAGDRVHVGPLVIPGHTACLTCDHTRRTELDPSWPLLAAQMIGGEAPATDPALVIEAAVLAARLLRMPPDETPESSLSVTVSSAHARRVWHVHRPHAQCSCRSPEGIAMVAEDAFPNVQTSSPTAFARRA